MNQSGTVNRNEFDVFIDSEPALAVFRDMKIQADEAMNLFDVLDEDGSGAVSVQEFIEGCYNMQGHGSAYNQMIMLKDLTEIKQGLKNFRKWNNMGRTKT